MDDLTQIKQSAEYIKKQTTSNKFDVAVVFGTGFGPSNELLKGHVLPYNTIPNFIQPSVKGHDGKLIYTRIANKNVLCFFGRIHYYQGFSVDKIIFPIRVIKELGVKTLVLTNSAGSINKKFKLGDLMIINDHINLMGINPFIGSYINENSDRFVDMSEPYSLRLIKILKRTSSISLKEGVYIGVSGPNYETPAEINFFRKIGGDVIGMSTVLETIAANYCKIETIGISCVANLGAGLSKKVLSHNKVIEIAKKRELDLISLIINFIGAI
ncbi:MAG: purine-nucleoside phosphorylase [Spirochaetes bacterium]|nr:purine-nucleoside phosphorylase [Spirochaetota bacterium]